MELRPYQTKLINDLRQSIMAGHRRIIIQLYVGGGKTVIASEIMRGAKDKLKKSIFLAPRRQLVYQTAETLNKFNINAGLIMAGERAFHGALAQVGSFDTITSRVATGRIQAPEAAIVLADECHATFSKARLDLLAQYPIVIGLTSTPALANGKGMGAFYTDIVQGPTMAEMVENGFLVPMRYFGADAPDLAAVKLDKDGDYQEKSLAEASDKPELIGAIYDNYKRIAGDRTTLIFAVNCKHARHIHDEFKNHGVSVEYIDGSTPTEEREAIKQRVESGQTKVIVNIGVMAFGTDWPIISCVIVARVTRNISAWIQMLGRGSRLHPGKEDCIARDTLILTDKGLVKIQDITLYHKLWDGVSWVEHGGAVCKGVKSTIEYSGLIATPDHRVMTDEGWKKFSEAANRRLRIIKSGFGRRAIRISENNFTKNRREKRQANGGSRLLAMWERVYDSLSQYTQKGESKALSGMQSKEQNKSATVDIQKMSGADGQMFKSEKSGIREIWSERNRISFRVGKCCGSLDSGESWHSEQHGISDRQNRQQQTLRTRESEVVNSCSKSGKYPLFRWWKKEAIYSIQRIISAYKVCRFNIEQAYSSWSNRWTDNRQIQQPFRQTKREVWDILNAGPLQRFTANGNLVHNCLVIYHGDNFEELGRIDDPIEWTLDDKTTIKERKERAQQDAKAPKEIKCKCGAIFRSSRICPACGHEMIPKGEAIPVHQAELKELKAVKKPTPAEKSRWYSELLGYARRNSKPDSYALALFRNKFNEWPANKRSIHPSEPSADVIGYIKHRNIAYAKGRAA